MAIPRYPAHLEKPERQMWKKLHTQYQIHDEAELKILESALSAHQRCRLAREQIDSEGMVIIDRFQQKKAHPLCSVERDARAQFLNALKLLNLDLPSET